MKELYTSPELEILKFAPAENIAALSNNGDLEGDWQVPVETNEVENWI